MKTKESQIAFTNIISVVFTLAFIVLLLYVFGGEASVNVYADNVVVDEYACGLLVEPDTSVYADADISIGNLPTSVDLSTLPAFPPIGNQGSYNSCAAWATTYYQFTFEVAKDKGWNAKTNAQYRFSPLYLYSMANKTGIDSGSNKTSNHTILSEIGALRYNDFYQDNAPLGWIDLGDDLSALYEALEFRISAKYKILFPLSENTPISGVNDVDVQKIKQVLANEHCVVMSVYNPGIAFEFGVLSNQEQGVIYADFSEYNEEYDGKHALTIVGYDDTITYTNSAGQTITGAFKVANSWGTDREDHDNGYLWIMYDAFNPVSTLGSWEPINTERESVLSSSELYYIDVEEYTPQYTVEVTLNQKYRNDISVSLLRNGIGSTAAEEQTFLTGYTAVTTGKNKKYNIDFDGNRTNPQYDSRTFVFDYDAYDLYDGTGYYYGIKIRDINENNAITTVERIVWKNGDTVIKEITPNEQLDGGNVSYYTPAQLATGLTLSHSQKTLREGDSHTLTATVLPADATVNSFNWESNNTSCVTVSSSGIVTAVGPGTATVTAYTKDGTEFSASCTYTVLNAFGDKWETAENCVYGTNKTMFSAADQECWAKYTPTETGTYLFYSLGNLDVVGGLYNEIADTIGQNNNISTSNKNFLFSANLTAGQTYRLIISSSVDDIGEFSFCVMKKEPYDPMYSSNYDARKIHFYVSAPSVYDSVRIGLGNYEINLTGQKITTNGYSNATIIYNGIKVKAILFAETPAVTYWTIYVDVSDVAALVGNAIDIDVEFYCGNVSGGEYNIGTGVIAYKTSLLSGVEVDASNSLQLLLDDITVANGEYLTVLNSNKQAITVTSTTKAATGMIILRKSSANNLIKEVMFVILIGDAQGDGYINSLDASLILQYDAETQVITGAYLIAADANFDGDVNNLDSSTILNYDAEIIDISQNLGTTVAPDWVYYQYEVEF